MTGEGLRAAGVVERGSFRLVADVHVAPGEVLGVLGPNGSGKTTLLRALAGLEALSLGSITLEGQVLDDAAGGVFVPAAERPVGLVFQSYRLFPHLTVLDNIAYGPRVQGAGRRSARATARHWLERLGLAALAARHPAEISGGQAQRVALARALAAGPRLLLLDEPLAALDARTRLEVRAALRAHLRGFDGPVLIITHDPLEAMVMCDRLLVIEAGRVVQEGTPLEVARRPATQYVARLVGLNLYAGSLDPRTRQVTLEGGGSLVVTLSEDLADGPDEDLDEDLAEDLADRLDRESEQGGGAAAQRVLVGLRPSAVTLHTSRPEHASPRNVWPGQVTALELLADRVRVQVEATPPALVDVSAAAVAELALAPGTAVWLSAKATETEAYPDPRVEPGRPGDVPVGGAGVESVSSG